MFKFISKLIAAAVLALGFAPIAVQADGVVPVIRLGYAKCAHCTSMSLVPEYAQGVRVEAIPFNTGNDVLTALVSKSVDIAQITYQHYAIALDKGFDVVAVSGHIGGGSTVLIANDLPVAENDWAGLKKLIAQYKKEGKPFRVAASRGNAQDIHMRGAFAKQGIDINKDVQFINIPNPADHIQAFRRGEVELITSVEPFATQILQAKAAKLFTYPYDQAAGNYSGLIMTRPDVIKSDPEGVQAVVDAMVKINDAIIKNPAIFVGAIQKVTGLDKQIAEGTISNLYPDYRMNRAAAVAGANMMRDLKYINSDVSAAVEKNMDYSFLEKATGKPKTELGY